MKFLLDLRPPDVPEEAGYCRLYTTCSGAHNSRQKFVLQIGVRENMAKEKKDKFPFINKIPFLPKIRKVRDEPAEPGSEQAGKSSSQATAALIVADTSPASSRVFLRASESSTALTRAPESSPSVNVVGQPRPSATRNKPFAEQRLQANAPEEHDDDETKP